MNIRFHELLLSELHMAVFRPGDPAELTDELLCKAVTLNENLRALAYTLRPEDLVRLAVSPSLPGFYAHMEALVPQVNAQPMYPGFPQQVMEMPEAVFRLHQALHYFSTYGLEALTDAPVSRGWLPDYEDPERTKSDTLLLEAHVLTLVEEDEAPMTALKRILERRERLTMPELELVELALPACGAEQLAGLTIRFKENLDLVFPLLVTMPDRKAALNALHSVCAHAGDVLRCSEAWLAQRRWHLRTTEKKLLVKLLESYSVHNLQENLMRSRKQRERSLRVLEHLDYNRFSRSPEHRELVRALRSGELLSWHGVGEKMIREHDPRALSHLAQRPGYMLRMLSRLLTLGYPEAEIEAVLLPRADAVSAHLLVKVLRTMVSRKHTLSEEYNNAVNERNEAFLWERTRILNRPDSAYGRALQNHRNAALHRRNKAKELSLAARRQRAENEAKMALFPADDAVVNNYLELNKLLKARAEFERSRSSGIFSRLRNARKVLSPEIADCVINPLKFRAAVKRLEREREELAVQYSRRREELQQELKQKLAELEAIGDSDYLRELAEIEAWEQEEQAALAQKKQEEIEELRPLLSEVEARRLAALAELEQQYADLLRGMQADKQAAEILKKLLKEHFRMVDTPLRAKKVLLRCEQYDLARSSLETEDRSQEGGYLRSGISIRIPEAVHRVRFFVYWNDPCRVDVDLHAGGRDLHGRRIHIGWNGEYCDSGLVHSGDITHSDAAEYIDIDLDAAISEVSTNIDLYSGQDCFANIETCFVGMMAVDQLGQDVKHYDPANCFFVHRLTQNADSLFYGYVDVENRCLRFIGKPNGSSWAAKPVFEQMESMFSLQDYLDFLFEAQGVQLVESEEEADLVLTMEKGMSDKGVSLVENNFFLEC